MSKEDWFEPLLKKAKKYIFEFIKKWLFEFLIKKIFGVAILGGIKGWLAKIAFKKLWKEIVKPNLQLGWRKLTSAVRKVSYKKKAKDLENAKTKDEAMDAIDNMP